MLSSEVRVGLESLPRHAWAVVAVLVLCVVYATLQVGWVRPYLPPAAPAPGGAVPFAAGPFAARPPDLTKYALREDAATHLANWREEYWSGLPQDAGRSEGAASWAPTHVGLIVQVVVFTGAAVVLFAVRSTDVTAALCVLALAFSAVAGGGPLYGAERAIPLGRVLTVFSWMATPLAFPTIALAILYFPARSPRLVRYPALHLVPIAAAVPMLVAGTSTALYLAGMDAALEGALWDGLHPGVYLLSFATALCINLLVVAEGTYRYRVNHDANERRRIRMALYTAVPGVLAYALKDGMPAAAGLLGTIPPAYPASVTVVLQLVVLLPAFGLVYAIGVARVLGPRVVLRRSLQYALATRTLTVLTILPAAALILSLARRPEARVRDVVSSVYLALLAMSVAAFVYRQRARRWLDEWFFREEYDARKILLSLAGRVRFETNPSDLVATVVQQTDEALHPEMVAILVSGVEEDRLTPVAVLHGSVESLPLDGGLVAMLRWSDEPLELFTSDPRSPVRRLPREEQEWIECTGAVLLIPVLGQDKSLIALIVLGARKSEEAYTAEDLELLANIAAQMALGFDVARLRRQMEHAGSVPGGTTRLVTRAAPMMECPRCGRCEDHDVRICPSDGAVLRRSGTIGRVLEGKYRLEQLLGRGGMGAVYQARDMRLDRMVAVKVVRSELIGDPDAQRRFLREAQIVARLQHPAIVLVFDYGTLGDGSAYLVMELVRGEDLRKVLSREGRLEPARAARILSSVCGAIEAAHRQGVLHRDLKPENILLPEEGVDAKVLDFGVAKVIGRERRDATLAAGEAATVLTVDGAVVGTPAYMAPEQLRGQTPDARADVFSLGVIAYEMLTGTLPFGRGSLAEVVLAQTRGLAPAEVDSLSPALARAVRAALDPDPDRRPPSPQAFAHLINATSAAWGM
jgi:hypothetical protein